jgi:hypothetical protein
VCGHIVRSLQDRQPRGFFWAIEGDQEYPDAWCAECNERLSAAGGEWSEALEADAQVRVLCARCYETARALNGF